MTELRMTSVVVFVPGKRSEMFRRLTETEAKELVDRAKAEGWVATIVTAPMKV